MRYLLLQKNASALEAWQRFLGCWRTELREEATKAQNLDVTPTNIMIQNSLKTVEVSNGNTQRRMTMKEAGSF